MSRHLITLSLLALAAPASAAPVRFDDWADNIAQVDYGNNWSFLPVRANVTGDDATGVVTFDQWDVYSDDRSLLAYSIPPQTINMTFVNIGWRGTLDTPEGDWLVHLLPRDRLIPPGRSRNQWRLIVFTDVPISGPYLDHGPNNLQLVAQILEAPEPASWLLLLGGVAPLWARRRWC